MLVKCKICGNKNEKADSYCIQVNGKNSYYCSETEYISHQKEREYKDLFYNELCECFGYEIKSSMLWKTIAELKELYSYEILYHTIIEKKSDIVGALPNLVNASEINKIKYTFAIISNSIKAVENKIRRNTYLKETISSIAFTDEYEEARFLNTLPKKPMRERKCLMDFLNEYEEEEFS